MNYKKIQKLLLVGQCIFSGLLLASTPMHSGLSLNVVMTAAEHYSTEAVDDFLEWRAEGDERTIKAVKNWVHRESASKSEEYGLFGTGGTLLFFYNGDAQCAEVLNWCICQKAGMHLRKKYGEQLVSLYESKDVLRDKAICHVEFGSGGLKQLFITAQGLASRGFKDLQLIGIDTDYEDGDDKEYFESAFNFLWQRAPVTATCTLKLYASNDEFLANFRKDFPAQLSIDSLSVIDLPPEAYVDLRTCIKAGPLSDDTSVVFAVTEGICIDRAGILECLDKIIPALRCDPAALGSVAE